jgi:GH18 family chitinase
LYYFKYFYDIKIIRYPTVFDGLDIDLEFPCKADDKHCGDGITPSSNDKDAFTQLIKEFRDALGSNYLLTIATSAEPHKAEALDFPILN